MIVPLSTLPLLIAFSNALMTNFSDIRSSTAQPTTRLLNLSCQLAKYPHRPVCSGR
jgi:hypothetical protein